MVFFKCFTSKIIGFCQSSIGLHVDGDKFHLEREISESEYNTRFFHSKQHNNVPLPVCNYELGFRKMVVATIDDVIDALSINTLSLLRIENMTHRSWFYKWLYRATTLSVFECSVPLPNDIIEHILSKNNLTHLSLNLREENISILSKFDMSNVTVTFMCDNPKVNTVELYLKTIEQCKFKNLYCLSLENKPSSSATRYESLIYNSQDSEHGAVVNYMIENETLSEKSFRKGCQIHYPYISYRINKKTNVNGLYLNNVHEFDTMVSEWSNSDSHDIYCY